jgi:hypothetical protein
VTKFILTGFIPDADFRVFTFERIEPDRTRTEFTVRADLSLSRKYGIHLQELPLLCRELLDRDEELAPGATLSFTEADMRRHQSASAAMKAAAAQKKASYKPHNGNAGAAWRTAQTQRP